MNTNEQLNVMYKELITEAVINAELKKKEQLLNKIQKKFGSLKANKEIQLKNAKTKFESDMAELKVAYGKKIVPKEQAAKNALVKAFNEEKGVIEARYAKRVGTIESGFLKAESNLMRLGKKTFDSIKKLKNPNNELLQKAFSSFKKIPYKKTAAVAAVGVGAGAVATYNRYKKLEKQKESRLKQVVK